MRAITGWACDHCRKRYTGSGGEARGVKHPGRRRLSRRWNCSDWAARRTITTDRRIALMFRTAT